MKSITDKKAKSAFLSGFADLLVLCQQIDADIQQNQKKQVMLEVQNIEDLDMYASPNLTRKTSDCLAVTNLTMGSLEYCSIIQFESTSKECRICLDQTEDQDHVFVSPCKCTGSLKFVHHSCFLLWLQRQYLSRSLIDQRMLQSEGLQCEICKQKVYLRMEMERKCLKKEQIASRIMQNFAAFLILILFTAVIGTSLGFVIYFMQNSSSSFGKDAMATSVLLCGLAFLLAACGFTFYYLALKYCIEAKSRLTTFSHRRMSVRSKNRKQVIPYRS